MVYVHIFLWSDLCFPYLLVQMLVAQSYLTLCDPMDCSPLDSPVLGILQARILEWVAITCRKSL